MMKGKNWFLLTLLLYLQISSAFLYLYFDIYANVIIRYKEDKMTKNPVANVKMRYWNMDKHYSHTYNDNYYYYYYY